jgi:hypothetical protein
MPKFNIELTDTYNGESNYSWVRRETLESNKDTSRSIVRAAKKWCDFTGLRCDVDDYGDTIIIRPHNINQVAFVTFD